MSTLESLELCLLNTIDECESFLIEATQKLVQSPSPNPPGDVSAAANTAIALIKDTPGIQVTTYETAPGITNVVAILDSGRPGKTLVFSGHLDTYPIGDAKQWTISPLGGAVSEDGTRLYGRGAADMKGGIAASIVAMRALATHKDSWDGAIVLALAGDEETMGNLGTASLLQRVHTIKHADAVIVGDAGSPLIVRIGEKGLLWLELTSTGKAAHGAHTHRGVNAIEALMEAILQIKKLEKWPVRPGEVSQTIDIAKRISEPLSGEGEAEVLKKITVNVGTINGGTSMNLVPDSASARLDIRVPEGVLTEQLMEYINESLSNLEGLEGVSCRVIQQYDPTWTPPSDDIVKCTLSAARAIIKPEATVNMRVGASDARLYRRNGIPTVVMGLTPYNMGGPDEYCLLEELSQVAKIHGLAALNFLRKKA